MAGSSNYPNAIDNKTPLQDGVDYIEADNVNNAYTPLSAIQTFIGAAGKPQSGAIDILEYLRYFGDPLNEARVEWVNAGSVKIKAGIVWCTNAAGSIRVPRKLTSDVTLTLADLDTGVEAASTKYYVLAVADGNNTSVTGKLSLSNTAPTGITTFAVLCSLVNNASSDIDKFSIRNLRDRVKTGAIEVWAGTIASLPEGRKNCDGAAISRTLFAELFSEIGTTYGTGDGSTTFNLPDVRDRFVVGAKQDDSGVAKTNLTGSLSKSGGDTNQPPRTSTQGSTEAHSSGPNGSAGAHSHSFVPPFMSFVVAIKI